MPDHVHMIIEIKNDKGTLKDFQYEKFGKPTNNSVSVIIGYIKGNVTREVNKRETIKKYIWQRNYYEHIIRNEREYLELCKYIQENPLRYYLKKHKKGHGAPCPYIE